MGRFEIPIGVELRFVFFGLESALGVSLDVEEMERVFSDAKTDAVSEKQYVFRQKPRVTGTVDHYEPGTIRVVVEHRHWTDGKLEELTENAHYHVHRLRKDCDDAG